MAQSIKQRCNALPQGVGAEDLRKLYEAVLVDMASLRAAHVALTAKLDADGDLTATDFGEDTDPAALTLTA